MKILDFFYWTTRLDGNRQAAVVDAFTFLTIFLTQALDEWLYTRDAVLRSSVHIYSHLHLMLN